jgi:tight adherence protein C
MSLAILCGLLVGLGLWLVCVGLTPRRRRLLAYVADMTAPVAPAPLVTQPGREDGWVARLGRLVVNADNVLFRSASAYELRLTGKTLTRHLGEKLLYASLAVVLVTSAATVIALAGVALSPPIPVGLALLLGAAFFALPDLSLREQAAARRREFRYAVMAFFRLVAGNLAGGAGVEAALAKAAHDGEIWPFLLFRHALAVARINRELEWEALRRLGEEVKVADLIELAATCQLAGSEGAKVRQSILAKLRSIGEDLRAEERSKVKWTNAKLVVAVALGAIAVMAFMVIPQLARVMSVV